MRCSETETQTHSGSQIGYVSRTSDEPQIDLSVVIPVCNEESCLEPLWDALASALGQSGRSWEVVFVDDGSTDGSLENLRSIQGREPAVRVVRLDPNQGQSAALDAGFRASRGEWVATLDADLQNPPREILRLLAASEGVDLVYGRRRTREDPWGKRLASRIGNAVRNGITGHRVHDTGCSLKLYRAEALERVPRFDGMHRFLPTLFVFHGFAVRELPVDHQPRVAGSSKYTTGSRAWRGLLDCLAVRWMRRRSLTYTAKE